MIFIYLFIHHGYTVQKQKLYDNKLQKIKIHNN